nr:uncharacterized protein LOC112275837 [Physcomitrium patens]|eukprot:XP_024362283.1 uncharacterized protein LOC112275837 [Physcomitrella patens]
MTGTFGVATAAAKPVSLIQRLKRGASATLVTFKAAPTPTLTEIERARPSSAQGIGNRTSSKYTRGILVSSGVGIGTLLRGIVSHASDNKSYRGPPPRSRNSSRMSGGVGPSITYGRGSTALKTLTSSAIKVRSLDEECSAYEKPSNVSNRGKRYVAENRDEVHINRGSTTTLGPTRPASTLSGRSKFANHRASGGLVWEISRNGSNKTLAASKTDLEEEERTVVRIPRRQNVRASQRNSNDSGYDRYSSPSDLSQLGHQQRRFRREPTRGLREWKGEFVRGSQRLEELQSCQDATGVATQAFMTTDGSHRLVENRPASASVRVIKGASLPLAAQHGVDQNWEPLRRQTSLLKDIVKDTKMREEVKNKAERLQLQSVDEIDLDEGGISRDNHGQDHVKDSVEEFTEEHRVDRLASSRHIIDQPCSLERTSLESLNKTMIRLTHGDYLGPLTPPLGTAAHLTLVEQNTNSPAGNASSSNSSTSHLQLGGKLQDQQVLHSPAVESRGRAFRRRNYEKAHYNANDEKIAHLQRAFGELKGSMEGEKIGIEVEGEGWRGGVDRLEMELESVKEIENELISEKDNFKNEIKTKLLEFKVDTEKLFQREREQVQMMVEERIERQLKSLPLGSGWAEVKNEMQLLWSEMDSLIKSRQDLANHVEHLTVVAKKEQDMLKSENGSLRNELQSLQDDGDNGNGQRRIEANHGEDKER